MQTAILRCVVRQINVGEWRCRCFPFENPNEDGVDLPFDDGCTILYVNGAYRGEDAIGRLMPDFCTPDADSMYYSKLAEMDKDVLKNFLDERKVEIMDYVWDMTDEEIEEQYRRSLVKEAVAENTAENARNFAIRMLEDGKCSIDDIARYAGLPVEEVERLSRLQLA